ncbi:hypothetical protein [uncultured Nostoc sp.]|uniref:hypothetical protein n=1 Tax=uncultured Nostoc sp. TaxID=340711 RepID=UPI0035C9868E
MLSNWLTTSQTAFAKIDILQPAPTQPLGYYDYFGKLLSPQEASQLVVNKRLDPNDPISYQRVGAVKITQELIAQGENILFNLVQKFLRKPIVQLAIFHHSSLTTKFIQLMKSVLTPLVPNLVWG